MSIVDSFGDCSPPSLAPTSRWDLVNCENDEVLSHFWEMKVMILRFQTEATKICMHPRLCCI